MAGNGMVRPCSGPASSEAGRKNRFSSSFGRCESSAGPRYRLRPLARVEQVASVGQVTELTLTGRSWTKGSTWAVQSARSGHSHNIIMEPESRGPGMCVQGVQGHCPEEGGVMHVEPP